VQKACFGESGGLFEPVQLAPKYLLANAEHDGEKYAASLGATSMQELRRLPAARLTGNADGIVHPVIDPYLLPASPYDAFTSGEQNDVPLLIGSNAEEARSLTDVSHVKAATFASDLEHSFGQLPPALIAAYPHATDEEARQARLDLERDLRFGWDMWAWARLQARTGQNPVFCYSFRQQPPFPAGSVFEGWGASHFAELWYVFDPGPGTLELEQGRPQTGRRGLQLLGQLREVGRSKRVGPSRMAGVQQRR
jgi:para-nitrobenzyl esterase